jgi:putative peptide zinc metalloprotease protein
MYVEFAIAALAAVVWSRTSVPAVMFTCHGIIVAAGVSSLLFNANPLMRFDAYYILADLLDIQNLYSDGRLSARAFLRKWFLAMDTPQRSRSGHHGWIVLVYGLAASMWRVVVSCSLILGAATLFHGAGLVLAALGVFFWFAMPILQLSKFVMTGNASGKPAGGRLVAALGCTIGAAAAIWLCPVPGGVSAPAVVDYEPKYELRAESAGFVRRVFVDTGQSVQAGQVLLTLESDELTTELAMVSAEARQSLILSRTLNQEGRQAEYQAELANHSALLERSRALRNEMSRLTIRSPAGGVVISRKPDELVGQYVTAGTQLISIAAESAKEIKISIPEYFIEPFLHHVGDEPTVLLDGRVTAVPSARLVSVDPGATDRLRYPELGAHLGGPLPVQPETTEDESGQTVGTGFKLVSPRFRGAIALPTEIAATLNAGHIGEVRFTDRSETFGSRLQRFAATWIGVRWRPGQ